ncbi:MAG: hypothetical protein QM645_06545 [Asticcacaulis sp.]
MAVQDRKRLIWLVIGGGAALLLAIVLALSISSRHKDGPRMNEGTSPGLVLNIDDAPTLDTQKELRCFVNAEFVGMLSIAECAQRNGVAAQSLDVGIDESGEMIAAPTASLAPPPVLPSSTDAAGATTAPVSDEPVEVVPEAPKTASGPVAACLRFSGGQWNRLSDSLTLGACVALLYDGRCERPGAASYGRWGAQTLRLVPKRVEVSEDNRNFRTLVEQGAGCSVK